MTAVLDRLVCPVQWKAAADGSGGLTGYLSTFGNVDLGGDVVMPGAFLEAAAAINAGAPIPLLADHVATTGSVLGSIVSAHEDAHGLLIGARFASSPDAQSTRTKCLEGHLGKLSMGYEALDESYADRGGQRVRLLHRVKLWEGSVVVFPMNTEAVLTGVKTADGGAGVDGLGLALAVAQAEVDLLAARHP